MVRLKINATHSIINDDSAESLKICGKLTAKMLRQIADELERADRQISCTYRLDSFTMMGVDLGWKGKMSYSVE